MKSMRAGAPQAGSPTSLEICFHREDFRGEATGWHAPLTTTSSREHRSPDVHGDRGDDLTEPHTINDDLEFWLVLLRVGTLRAAARARASPSRSETSVRLQKWIDL